MLYLIPFLHQTTTFGGNTPNRPGCILFHFYIKPQLTQFLILGFVSCILFHFYIKPQPNVYSGKNEYSCILFHFYIKPQLSDTKALSLCVVSYSISTSNHNSQLLPFSGDVLYLIPFLHQTTTLVYHFIFIYGCILFHFYIKPQHCYIDCKVQRSCILFHFYIKPQLLNTNVGQDTGCILFHFYIKPQLQLPFLIMKLCCILFHFYIKPQLNKSLKTVLLVVSYSISTSNHNYHYFLSLSLSLYLIPFLHQTTTVFLLVYPYH